MGTSSWAPLVALAIACNGGGDRAERVPDSAGMMGHMDSSLMGMGGMQMQGLRMMPRMRAHLDSIMRMSPSQMQAAMARHESLMSQMMDGMGTDMRGMKMAATPEWTALADSVKEDLGELADLRGQELSARMRSHAGRVRRLLAMHEAMMDK